MAITNPAKGGFVEEKIQKRVDVGLIDICARTLCDQIRRAGVDPVDLDPETRMALACLREQLERLI